MIVELKLKDKETYNMSVVKDTLYVDIEENTDRVEGDKKPIFVGVRNEKNPKVKKGVKIGDDWYSVAVFQGKDFETGDPIPGRLTIKLEKNKPMQGQQPQGGYQQRSFGNNNFQKKQNYGNYR
jgi:hypothetical protein